MYLSRLALAFLLFLLLFSSVGLFGDKRSEGEKNEYWILLFN